MAGKASRGRLPAGVLDTESDKGRAGFRGRTRADSNCWSPGQSLETGGSPLSELRCPESFGIPNLDQLLLTSAAPISGLHTKESGGERGRNKSDCGREQVLQLRQPPEDAFTEAKQCLLCKQE
ncbi:UNVERIFIED_CONTAM: hypothetical protein K2H54_003675 [Gekko kuhli]